MTLVLYDATLSSLVINPIENLTSSAVNGPPLWNLMFSRNVKDHVWASSLILHSLEAPFPLSISPASFVPLNASNNILI